MLVLPRWEGDLNDRELYDIMPFLESIENIYIVALYLTYFILIYLKITQQIRGMNSKSMVNREQARNIWSYRMLEEK